MTGRGMTPGHTRSGPTGPKMGWISPATGGPSGVNAVKCAGDVTDNSSMRTIPQRPLSAIQFAEAHQPVWEVDPAQIGLTGEQVAALYEQMKLARDAYDRAVAAREASIAATAAMHTQAAGLRAMLGGYVATIKAFARTGGPEGYPPDQILALAQIDPPRAPGEGGPDGRQSTTYGDAPGKPARISADLAPTGAVRLSWTARDAAAGTGAFFEIARRLDGETAFTILGTSPGLSRARRRAEFVDEALPAGIASAQYRVVGRRARAVGEAGEIVTVTLGVHGLTRAA